MTTLQVHCHLKGQRLSPQSPLSSWPAPTPSLRLEGTTCGYQVNSGSPSTGQAPRPVGRRLPRVPQGRGKGTTSTHTSLGRKGFIYPEQRKRCEVPSVLRYFPSLLNLLPPSSRPRGPSLSATPKTCIYNQSHCGILEAPHGGRGTETATVGCLSSLVTPDWSLHLCALERSS